MGYYLGQFTTFKAGILISFDRTEIVIRKFYKIVKLLFTYSSCLLSL